MQFVIAVHSFVELVKYLLHIPEVKVFLSNELSQDPIEKFFGQQRQRGSSNENPNVTQFVKGTQALRVINTTCADIRVIVVVQIKLRKPKSGLQIKKTRVFQDVKISGNDGPGAHRVRRTREHVTP